MELVIKCGGVTRVYMGDYEELHANDWNEIVRDFLDTQYEQPE